MRELNPEAASLLIRDILIDGIRGSLSFTKHAREQMALRSYTTQDVVYILETGSVMEIELKPNGQRHCRIEGCDLDGDRGIVIMAIIDERHLLVITVLGGT
jgi:hypothetical protein